MYTVRPASADTVFRFSFPRARSVTLVGNVIGDAWRRPLKRRRGSWETTVDLPPGWFFYSVEVDGRLTWDRDAGKARTRDGQPCSLACIDRYPGRSR